MLVKVKFCVLYAVSDDTLAFWLLSAELSDSESQSAYSHNIINFELITSEAILVLGIPADNPKCLVSIESIVTLKVYPVLVCILYK